MNEQFRPRPMLHQPADDHILAGVRRRMADVEPLLPAAPAWVPPTTKGATGARRVQVRVRSRAYGLRGLAVAFAAVAIVALVVGPLGFRGAPGVEATGSPRPLFGMTVLRYAVDSIDGRSPTKVEETQLFDMIGARLRAAGIAQFEMAAGYSLEIDIHGPVDLTAVRYLLGHRGVFEIVPLPPGQYGTYLGAGPKEVPASGDQIDPALPVLIPDGDLLRNQIKPDSSTGLWDVQFRLNADGAGKLVAFSTAHVNDFIAIVLDGKVVSAPYIHGPITDGSGTISGNFTASEAMLLAMVLQNGPLAFPIHEISAANGPSSTTGS